MKKSTTHLWTHRRRAVADQSSRGTRQRHMDRGGAEADQAGGCDADDGREVGRGIAMCTPTDGARGGARREMWEGDGGRGEGGAIDAAMRLAGCSGTHLRVDGDCRRREKDYGWRNSGGRLGGRGRTAVRGQWGCEGGGATEENRESERSGRLGRREWTQSRDWTVQIDICERMIHIYGRQNAREAGYPCSLNK